MPLSPVAAKLGGVDLGRALILLNANAAAEGGWGSQIGNVFAGMGIGLGTALVAGGVAVAVIVASGGGDDNPPGTGSTINGVSGDGDRECGPNDIDVIGPCSPLGIGGAP